MAASVAFARRRLVFDFRRLLGGEQGGHELTAQTVHVVEERPLELARAGDAVALYRLCRGVDEGVDLRGAREDELREFFFRGDADEAISCAFASESSNTSSLSLLPAAAAALNSATLSTGIANEWFFPLWVYCRL